MGIFDRLGDVIKSYLNDEDGRIFGRPWGGDPDIEEAEAELESFLRGEGPQVKAGDWDNSRAGDRGNFGGAWSGGGTGDWGKGGTGSRAWGDSRDDAWGETGNRAWNDGGNRSRAWSGTGGGARRWDSGEPPERLQSDFAELGLPFGAGAEECKAAYRRLLKLHHPDRHAGHQGNMDKATKKMAKINAAYDRIEKWRAGKD
jgi:hypothetical protein